MTEDNNTFIHPTAIIDQGAQIGKNSQVWHWTHISKDAVIGKNCKFGQNVFIANQVKIGNNVKIQNNVSVYDQVFIEDDVFCGPSVVFTNVYNPRSFINRKCEYRKTVIKKGVSLGANSTIICGITIDEYAFIGAGSVINKNIISYALVVGNPGKQIGWMSQFGEQIPLPLKGTGKFECNKTKKLYKLVNNRMVCIDLN